MPKDMEIRILRREADGVDIPLCVCVREFTTFRV